MIYVCARERAMLRCADLAACSNEWCFVSTSWFLLGVCPVMDCCCKLEARASSVAGSYCFVFSMKIPKSLSRFISISVKIDPFKFVCFKLWNSIWFPSKHRQPLKGKEDGVYVLFMSYFIKNYDTLNDLRQNKTILTVIYMQRASVHSPII